MKMLWALPILLLSGCKSPVTSATAAGLPPSFRIPAKVDSHNFTVDGETRTYIMHLPPSYAGGKVPLVVAFHGHGGSSDDMERTLGPKAESSGFVLVSPQATGNPSTWHDNVLAYQQISDKDFKFFPALLHEIQKQVNVDPSRIFLAGHSNGAGMVDALAARFPDQVAAICSVAGSIMVTGEDWVPHMVPLPKGPVNVLHIHGVADPIVKYEGGWHMAAPLTIRAWAERLNAHGPKRTTIEGGATSDLFSGGDGGTEVVLISHGGGHEWPAQGADWMWNFFQGHPKRTS